MVMDYSLVQRIIDGLGKILDTKPGSPDEGTYVTEQQLADWIKSRIFVPGYLYNGVFYSDAGHTSPIVGQTNVMYFDLTTGKDLYVYDGATYDPISDSTLRQDILDGTVVAKKAECDEDGNNIKATYATKTEMQAADTNLNNAISQLDHRLENIEQSKGDYIVSSYKDGSVTPSGKGKWCVVEGVEGVSRCENQLVPALNNFSATGCTKGTYSDGIQTLTTFTNNAAQLYKSSLVLPTGRTVLGSISVKPSKQTRMRLSVGYEDVVGNTTCPASVWTTLSNVLLLTRDSMEFSLWLNLNSDLGADDTVDVKIAIFRDLSVYFGGAIPSDAQTIADIQRDYPHLLIPSDYGTRIIDWTGNGVRAEGVNIWDEEWESGLYNQTTGEKQANGNYGRSKNLISVTPNESYYFKVPTSYGQVMYFAEFDASGNYIGYSAGLNSAVQIPSNCVSVGIYMYGWTSNNHDIQICDNSLPDAVKQTYHPYQSTTLSFPSTTLKSAGSVRDTLELNVEVEGVARRRDTQRIGSGTIAIELIYTRNDNPNVNYAVFTAPTSFSTILANMRIPTCESGYGWGWDSLPRPNMYLVYSSANNQIAISVSKSTTLEQAKAQFDGLGFNYALATESVTLSDPILDNTLLTESGGRLSTVQTGTVVDGIADLGFITL